MSGNDELQEMIAKIRALGKLGEEAAPDVAYAVEADLRRSIGEGTDPDGKPWDKTQAGETPLRNADKAVHVAAVGGTIFVRLTGPEARHHKGSARGGIVRAVIPTKSVVPDRMAAAVRGVLVRHFERVTSG